MATFKYTAIDSSGKQKTGRIDAPTQDDANTKLSGMGLMVSTISLEKGGSKAKASKSGGKKGGGGFRFGKVLNEEALTIFTRQMATLLQAGLPILRGLDVMIRQEKNPAFKDVLTQIADNVRSGGTFSDGLAKHTKVFDHLYINMIRAGEAGGVLDVVLSRLARFMEKSVKTKKKVKSAMVYPMVVISVAVTIVALLMVFVVPKFQDIFSEMLGGAKMPWLTEKVIGFSNFLKDYSIVAVIIVVVGIFAMKFALKTKGGTRAWDWLALRIPKIGTLASMAAISRFSRTFGTLLASGVPILQALNITRDTIGNVIIMDALDRVHDRVRDGETIAAPLEQQKVFPTVVTSMVDVGEETGELPEMLNRIADNYDEDVDNAVAGITSIIEPVMIVMLALVVGTIVIALFLPIIDIIKNLTA